MNFIKVDLKSGRTALINLDTVEYITENSDYDTTVSFTGGKQNLVLDERWDDIASVIETMQRRNNR